MSVADVWLVYSTYSSVVIVVGVVAYLVWRAFTEDLHDDP